jgi:hypothetical protein
MSPAGLALRGAVLIAAILIAGRITAEFREALDLVVMPHNEIAVHRSIMLATGAFVILLAVPFVPGAEIGLTLLTVFGPPIAPLVYGATVGALTLSYLVGRLLPPATVAAGLRALRLARAAETVEAAAPLPREARLALLLQGGTPWALRLATRFRYAALLVAINVPGNFLIGGGGGIALMAGMSGLFAPIPFLLTVALAVAPVPLAILLFGA